MQAASREFEKESRMRPAAEKNPPIIIVTLVPKHLISGSDISPRKEVVIRSVDAV